MNSYISHALRVISDPEQTYEAKQVAQEILLNSGYKFQDIEQLKHSNAGPSPHRTIIFMA
jgi:hypothetical protein